MHCFCIFKASGSGAPSRDSKGAPWSVRSLGAGDRRLLEEMSEMGNKLMMADHAGLRGADTAKWRFVFHVPPFNSIDHLHLHCLKPPLRIDGKT